MKHEPALRLLRTALDELQQNHISVSDFCQAWRAHPELIAALPSRYGEVMEDLLGRLEAGSLFSEESCSFSQQDLQANLAAWLQKASTTVAEA